jgi:short-subunit dehydrogenase involved in D-alanine esterification of teichoic acids
MTAFLKFTVKQGRWMPIERAATNIDHAAAQDEKIGAARSIIANVTAGYPFKPMATEPTYCYHCRMHHPRNEMRLIVTKTGKRWRCIRSIEATLQGPEAREAYGRQVSEINKAESKSRAQRMNNLLQEK